MDKTCLFQIVSRDLGCNKLLMIISDFKWFSRFPFWNNGSEPAVHLIKISENGSDFRATNLSSEYLTQSLPKASVLCFEVA